MGLCRAKKLMWRAYKHGVTRRAQFLQRSFGFWPHRGFSGQGLKRPEWSGDRLALGERTASPNRPPPTWSLRAQNNLGLHKQQRVTPAVKPSACQDPEAPIRVAQARSRMTAPQNQ